MRAAARRHAARRHGDRDVAARDAPPASTQFPSSGALDDVHEPPARARVAGDRARSTSASFVAAMTSMRVAEMLVGE